MPFKLSPDIVKQIAELAADLNAHVDELRVAYTRESQEWRSSTEGLQVAGWLIGLENAVDTLHESTPETPKGWS